MFLIFFFPENISVWYFKLLVQSDDISICIYFYKKNRIYLTVCFSPDVVQDKPSVPDSETNSAQTCRNYIPASLNHK